MPTVSYGITNTADDVSYAVASGALSDQAVLAGDTTPLGVPGGLFAGLRFPAVQVPAGATITAATLTLKLNTASPGFGSAVMGTTFGLLKGVASDNAPSWSTTGPQSAAKTSQSVTITSDVTKVYDVTAIVAAIIARPGWALGNALAFAGDPTGANGFVEWIDRTSSSTDCAQLSITYTAGGPTPRPTFQAFIIG